ncbi:MAG: PTS sugar transporter subunit IIA [bacterium]
MRITDILDKQCIKTFLVSGSKIDIINELVNIACTKYPELNEKHIVKAVLDRENIGSTGIGGGIAIPHALTESCNKLIAVFGLSKDSVPFDSLDARPVKLFFLVLCPKDQRTLQIRFLARISRILNDPKLKKALLNCQTPQEVFDIFVQYENSHVN